MKPGSKPSLRISPLGLLSMYICETSDYTGLKGGKTPEGKERFNKLSRIVSNNPNLSQISFDSDDFNFSFVLS